MSPLALINLSECDVSRHQLSSVNHETQGSGCANTLVEQRAHFDAYMTKLLLLAINRRLSREPESFVMIVLGSLKH